jgi:hypothetical protein
MSEELPEYTNEDHKQFVTDMQAVGLKVRHYRGRFFYQGPAVVVPEVQNALSKTQVQCTWDNMGKEYIVYPRS